MGKACGTGNEGAEKNVYGYCDVHCGFPCHLWNDSVSAGDGGGYQWKCDLSGAHCSCDFSVETKEETTPEETKAEETKPEETTVEETASAETTTAEAASAGAAVTGTKKKNRRRRK